MDIDQFPITGVSDLL